MALSSLPTMIMILDKVLSFEPTYKCTKVLPDAPQHVIVDKHLTIGYQDQFYQTVPT